MPEKQMELLKKELERVERLIQEKKLVPSERGQQSLNRLEKTSYFEAPGKIGSGRDATNHS